MKENAVVSVGPTRTKDFFVPRIREPIGFKARHDFSFLLHK